MPDFPRSVRVYGGDSQADDHVNYRHYRDIGARTISHAMDPRSGLPLETGLASVTVLADTCMEADAWATAFLVMGAKKALPLAQATGRDVIFVLADGTVETTL